ncbi:MAG: hypothetical protein KGJ78_16170 [Alphaproteobacteria bacterium]|nr:hypothetical protein [Alphaproteobacteria bacterium]
MALAGAALAAAMISIPATAQSVGGPPAGGMSNTGGISMGNHMGQNNMTQQQFDEVQEYADRAKRLTKEDKAKGRTLEQLLAEDKATAEALAKSMPLNCEVASAMLAAQGPATVNGRAVDTKSYETACTNGMGYFLISQEPEKPYGFSCFAADATHQADIAAGRPGSAVCQLPPNSDVNSMATNVMTRLGTPCTVRDHRWLGQSTAANTEFDEVACQGGAGYVLSVPMPGSLRPIAVTTCHDSAMRGLPCKLSDNGALVTMQTFRDALSQHNVQCNASDKDMRFIGQENVQKRYVVELKCSQKPGGLVAFIPLNSNTAPFEALSCAAAAKRGVKCQLKAD